MIVLLGNFIVFVYVSKILESKGEKTNQWE